MKRKRVLRLFAVLIAVMTSLMIPMTVSADLGYSYNYDWWEDIQYSPDPYEVVGVYSFEDFGLDVNFKSPDSLYIIDNTLYIVDTGNNRILEVVREENGALTLARVIDHVVGVTPSTFNTPMDVCVDVDGYIYITDKGNNRILKVTKNLRVVQTFTKPTDNTFDQSLAFLPEKIVVDEVGRVYCIAENVNKGLIKYESNGEFKGFTGASQVTYDWIDYLWKKLSTKAQRAAMESFVPTEYDNIAMDDEGFIYACTTNVKASTLRDGSAKPIRRLNLMGSDILIRNGNTRVIGDVQWESGAGYSDYSLITDVCPLDEGVYVALDRNRGHIFAYDNQGNMLYAFGGPGGNLDGHFEKPCSIDNMGHDLFVLDPTYNSITVFTPTEYGRLMFDAIRQYNQGDYITSGETWEKVLAMNGNCDLAYIGIGRSLLRQKKYKEAMEYFELKFDDDNYSKAFKQYRKQWVEEHIALIIVVLIVLIVIPLAIGKVKKIKHEIDIADIFRI